MLEKLQSRICMDLSTYIITKFDSKIKNPNKQSNLTDGKTELFIDYIQMDSDIDAHENFFIFFGTNFFESEKFYNSNRNYKREPKKGILYMVSTCGSLKKEEMITEIDSKSNQIQNFLEESKLFDNLVFSKKTDQKNKDIFYYNQKYFEFKK